MTHSIRILCAGAAALALFSAISPADAKPAPLVNRSLDTIHQPIVSRTDYVFDATTGPAGLAQGEANRLAGWFDGLGLSYGDTITLDTASVWRNTAAADAVSAIAAQYGMLLSHDSPPLSAGHPATGAVRIVVSRATARVDGCPDYSVGNMSDYSGAMTSNFGCALTSNLAAMIANPEDLVEGRSGSHGDADVSMKAIKTYRDATPTGAAALKQESSKGGN